MPQQFDFPKSPIQLNFNPRTVYLVLGILAILWVLSGIYTVGPDENAVILRFGKLHEVVDPGLHYHWPAPIEMALVRSVTRVYREEVGFQTIDPGPPAKYRRRPKEALMLTGDENIVNVEMVVQYKVSSVTEIGLQPAAPGPAAISRCSSPWSLARPTLPTCFAHS